MIKFVCVAGAMLALAGCNAAQEQAFCALAQDGTVLAVGLGKAPPSAQASTAILCDAATQVGTIVSGAKK